MVTNQPHVEMYWAHICYFIDVEDYLRITMKICEVVNEPRLEEGENSIKLVIDKDVIGYIGYRVGKVRSGLMGEISLVRINPEWRGKSYGTKLYIALAKMAKTNGLSYLTSNLSGNLSYDAEKVWIGLQNKGFKIKEIESHESPTGYKYFQWNLKNMKINEVIQPISEFNFLKKKEVGLSFEDEDSLKAKIVENTDLVIKAYREGGEKKFGIANFSNNIAQNIKNYTTSYMIKKYKVDNPEDQQKLKEAVNNTISLHYIEYKLNGVMY